MIRKYLSLMILISLIVGKTNPSWHQHTQIGSKVAFLSGISVAGRSNYHQRSTRFYDIRSGMITYDGIDIKISEKDSTDLFSDQFFKDTTYFVFWKFLKTSHTGRCWYNTGESLEAAPVANVDSFVKLLGSGLWDGLDRWWGWPIVVNDNWSYYPCSPCQCASAILDESGVIDSQTGKWCRRGWIALMEGRTVFIVAVYRRCQFHVSSPVMDHRRIIERGNHTSLG